MLKSLKVRLELNNVQRSLCEGHAGLSRLAYNKGLAYCKERYEAKEKHPTSIDLHKWFVAGFKQENSWVYDYSKCSPQQAFRDLDTACDAYVGVHKGTSNALGRLANKELRYWKKEAHSKFDPIWMLDVENGCSKYNARNKAYKWLSDKMELPIDLTHIGMMDVEQCKQVVELCNCYNKNT